MGFLGNCHIWTTTVTLAVVACKVCPRETKLDKCKGRFYSMITTPVQKRIQRLLSSASPKPRTQLFKCWDVLKERHKITEGDWVHVSQSVGLVANWCLSKVEADFCLCDEGSYVS